MAWEDGETLLPPPESQTAAISSFGSPAPRPLRLLLVEDSTDDAELVLRELHRGGFRVRCRRVETSDTMMAALREQEWDLVITDHDMPCFSAPRALEVLQQSGLDLPILIVSGAIGEEIAVAAMKAGAHDYLSKDRLGRLVPAVTRELREAEGRRERRRAQLELRASEKRYRELLEVARDISGTLDVRELLHRVQRRTAEVLPCDRVAILCVDAERGVVAVRAHYGIPAALVAPTEALIVRGQDPPAAILERGETVVLNDVRSHGCIPERFYEPFGVHSILAVPLRVRQHYLGALVVANAAGKPPFDADQVALCEGIGRQLAVAIEAAELYRAAQEEARVAAALAQVGRALISVVSTPALLDRLCRLVVEALGASASHVLIWQPQQQGFATASTYGYSPTQEETLHSLAWPAKILPLPRLETDDIVEVGTPIGGDAGLLDAQRGCGVTNALYTALRRGDDVVGILVAGNREPQRFSGQQRRIFRGIAQTASLAMENTRLVEQLKRADRLKADFVATMSHELRTPLNIIMGYDELLLEGVFGTVNEEQADGLRRIQKSTAELLDLINATLDLNHLQAGLLSLDVQAVDLRELITEAGAEVRERWPKTEVDFEYRVDPALPVLRSDGTKLKIVLKNLLTNAVKFTDRGRVTAAAHEIDGGVEVSVSDTGIGIDPEALPIIFEPFRQADSSPTRRYGGAGLGLHIAWRFVTMLGGTIVVESEPGRGSTFRVWVPLDFDAGPSRRPPVVDAAPAPTELSPSQSC